MSLPEKDQIEIMKTQLHLTTYETVSLIMVIYGKEHPSTISEAAHIPRSKVYGALDSLEAKGLVTKNADGNYEPKLTKLSSIKKDSDKLVKNYTAFMEKLYTHTIGSNKILSNIKKEIPSALERIGYKVETEDKISKLIGDREVLRSRYRVNNDYPRRMSIRDVIREDEEPHLPSFIAESPNSGIRIGIIIVNEIDEITDAFRMTSAILETVRCNMCVVITTSVVESDHIKSKFDEYRYFKLNFHVISTTREPIRELEHFLQDQDLIWSQLKSKLAELEGKHEQAKQMSRKLMYEIEDISKREELYPHDYRLIFEDILTRIKNDIETNIQLLSVHDESISAHFDMLARKVLYPIESLSFIEKRLENTVENLKEKGKELRNFEEELYSLPSEKNPYTKYGFKLNPFSLSVPLDRPEIIIDQIEPQRISEEFIKGVTAGSDANFMLIVGNQGVGKSHFLNYHANKINNGNFGKSIALKIRCKSNRDIVDLYPQIIDDLNKVLKIKGEEELLIMVSHIIKDSGTPRLVQDLMKILREIEIQISTRGYKNIFILIDEFENSLQPLQDEEEHPQYERDRRKMGTPQAILQLASLTRVSGIGFFVTFRRTYWRWYQAELKDRISKMENKYVINMESLTLPDSKSFLLYRLETNEFKSNPASKKEPIFTDESIEYIWKQSEGNPRAMLRLAATAFRKAVRDNMTEIVSGLIE